jgi:hypothetical protein
MAGTLVANTINTDTGLFSTQNAYQGIAKAWVNFVGSTAVINGSFNVSSVTRNATGDYTINFTTAMTNANYAITFGVLYGASTTTLVPCIYTTPTTTTYRMIVVNSAGVNADLALISTTVNGA